MNWEIGSLAINYSLVLKRPNTFSSDLSICMNKGSKSLIIQSKY